MNVRIGDDDELGTFIFRTTGFNSIRTLAARLTYLQSVSGDLLSCLPLELRLRGKSSSQSHRAPIFYADLTVREGLTLAQAIEQAKALHQERMDAGFNQEALERTAWVGLHNAAFEMDAEEIPGLLEEFFSEEPQGKRKPAKDEVIVTDAPSQLLEQLERRQQATSASLN